MANAITQLMVYITKIQILYQNKQNKGTTRNYEYLDHPRGET